MSRHLPRPRPGLPLLRRGRGTVQIGVDPETAVVVDRLTDDAATALLHIDGETGRHDVLAAGTELGPVLDRAPRARPPRRRPGPDSQLVARTAVNASDPISRAPRSRRRSAPEAMRVLARRSRATVALRGSDTTATHIALGLAAAGIGTVALEGPDHEVDARRPHRARPVGDRRIVARGGRPRPSAARGRTPPPVGTSARGRSSSCSAAPRTATCPWTDPELADDLLADDVPHLAVATAGAAARVGPLVVPGASACLWCADRRATELDPAWPAIADQLRLQHPRARAVSTPLTALCAAYAVTEVLAVVDRARAAYEPLTLDAQLELRVADPLPRVLAAPPHPLCGCGWGRPADTMAG